MDPFTLFLIMLVSILSGVEVYQFTQEEPVEEVEDNSLGEYVNSPAYSQGILDFYKKTIQEWVVIKFQGWKNTHNMKFSNTDHFKKLIGEILLDFFKEYSLQNNIKFEYCLFTEDYLTNYISMVAMETMAKLVDIESEKAQEE